MGRSQRTSSTDGGALQKLPLHTVFCVCWNPKKRKFYQWHRSSCAKLTLFSANWVVFQLMSHVRYRLVGKNGDDFFQKHDGRAHLFFYFGTPILKRGCAPTFRLFFLMVVFFLMGDFFLIFNFYLSVSFTFTENWCLVSICPFCGFFFLLRRHNFLFFNKIEFFSCLLSL